MATSRISPLRPSIRLSPAHSRENSRSTSPDRHPQSLYQKIDPLLANLSPESTLNALTSTEAVPSNDKLSHDTLSQSISQVSPAERALGIRAAVAAQNLQLWYKEVQAWKWPKQVDAKQGKGFVPPVESSEGDNESRPSDSSSLVPPGTNESVYYGCLPASMVEEYEQRIEEIRDGMENLNVEELKEHVLSAHIPSRSRPSSSTSTMSVPPPLSYVQLSDFTAVVTATILRALPFLSRLNNLLITWDVRLLVLRQIPGLLRELKLTRSSLDTSFHALRTANPSEKSESFLSASRLRIDHVQLESAVVSVGRRMDRALDVLEGRQDSLPESWIDELEKIESDFAAWVVEAEQYKLRTEWLRAQEQQAQKKEEPESSMPSAQEKPESSTAEPQLDVSPAEVVQAQGWQEHAHMETIEEEPKAEPEPIAVNDNKDEPDISQAINDSILSSTTTESDSSLPAVSEPDTPSSLQTQEEAKPVSQVVHSVCINEGSDTPTPTQSAFPPLPLIKSPEEPSPTRIPLPATPIIENKENIPPAGLNTQPALSSRESSARSAVAALAEHDIENDSSIQKAPSTTATDALEAKQVDSSVHSPFNVPVGTPTRDTSHQSPKPAQFNKPHIADAAWIGKNLRPSQIANVVQDSSKPAMTPVAEAPLTKATPAIPSTKEPTAIVATDKSMAHSSPVHSLKSPHSRIPVSQHMHRPIPQQIIPQDSTDSTKVSFENTSEPQKSTPQKKVPSKKPLQSPIKLSKTRPAKLNLDKTTSKPRYRRPSTGSIGSLPSNNSSLASSTDALEPNTDSSKDGPLLTPPLSEFPQPPSYPPRGDHALRADRLRHLENRKISPRVPFQDSRSVSLPLQRFINEKLDLQMDREPVSNVARHPQKQPLVPAELEQQSTSLATPPVPPRGSSRRPALTRGKSASDLKSNDETQKRAERSVRTTSKSSTLRSVYNQDQPKSLQLRQRLTAHPSLESLGVKRRELEYVEEDVAELTDPGSRASSPNKARRKPRDRLDEKVNSILSRLPGRIDLVDPHHEADTSSSSSSTDRRIHARYLSESPPGAPSRSTTPGPSLTLMPATRRRSQVFKSEDSCVRLYHLQHSGQTAPTKLFVRTVGEENQRVMVRVGGGWADLGEYLREYVIHHGRRKVSETPRVEVQGLSSRTSPGHSTPGSMLTPAPPSYMTSGRATPSRPPSVMSARPASSLNVRKVRRGSNASDAVGTRAVTTSALASFTSPPSASSGRRRLSVSSNYSLGDVQSHSPGNTSSLAPDSHSTPLGLAGPKPRARHVSMSPEGEAWVEDVLQQTRRSSSLNPPPFPLNAAPSEGPDQHDVSDTASIRSLPKVRSVGDIGSAGTSRRVVLKGLNNRR
ncbi:hypothetical protein PENSTE_c011G01400 [Penicillium steckii]|uniref:GAR domain-containing protein n=1 Tax=Penicillium steckii TaxID=303698 RepID=A0A1V6T6J0_9EURO|nr:hypothetical protein PENSTE_c011G01400 [Penicillium steckii]